MTRSLYRCFSFALTFLLVFEANRVAFAVPCPGSAIHAFQPPSAVFSEQALQAGYVLAFHREVVPVAARIRQSLGHVWLDIGGKWSALPRPLRWRLQAAGGAAGMVLWKLLSDNVTSHPTAMVGMVIDPTQWLTVALSAKHLLTPILRTKKLTQRQQNVLLDLLTAGMDPNFLAKSASWLFIINATEDGEDRPVFARVRALRSVTTDFDDYIRSPLAEGEKKPNWMILDFNLTNVRTKVAMIRRINGRDEQVPSQVLREFLRVDVKLWEAILLMGDQMSVKVQNASELLSIYAKMATYPSYVNQWKAVIGNSMSKRHLPLMARAFDADPQTTTEIMKVIYREIKSDQILNEDERAEGALDQDPSRPARVESYNANLSIVGLRRNQWYAKEVFRNLREVLGAGLEATRQRVALRELEQLSGSIARQLKKFFLKYERLERTWQEVEPMGSPYRLFKASS